VLSIAAGAYAGDRGQAMVGKAGQVRLAGRRAVPEARSRVIGAMDRKVSGGPGLPLTCYDVLVHLERMPGISRYASHSSLECRRGSAGARRRARGTRFGHCSGPANHQMGADRRVPQRGRGGRRRRG
jgi:hypothetical protein